MSDIEEIGGEDGDDAPPPRRGPGRPRKISNLEAVQRRAAELEAADRAIAASGIRVNPILEEPGDLPEEGESAAPAPRRPGFGTSALSDEAIRHDSGLPPTASASELGLIDLIDEWITKLRRDPQAFVLAWRVRPEFHEGKPCTGVSGRWSILAVKDANDLLAEVEQASGGYVYQLRFYAYDGKVGKVKMVKMFSQVPINAPPILRGEEKKDAHNNSNGHVLSPDAEMMKANMELLRDHIKNLQSGGGPQGREMSEVMKLIREVADSKNDFLQRELEAMRTAQGNPSSDTLNKMQADARRELDQARERWEQDRKHDRERWDTERTQLLRDHKDQTEKLVEKLESAQDKLKEREEGFSRERIDRERSFDERSKHRDELHARDTESLRGQRDSDVKRLNDQLSDERRATERLKEMYELAKKTELDKQEGIFREQLKGQENRIGLLEERIRDLEKQKEELQRNLLTVQTQPKPDAFSTVKDTLGALASIGGQIGWKPPGSGSGEPVGEMRTEMGQLMKDMKDSGVIDAGKSVLEKVTSAIGQRQQAAAPQPQPQQQMPMSPFNIPGAFPVQIYPQQQFVPQPQPQPQAAPPPPPAPIVPVAQEPIVPEVVTPSEQIVPQVLSDNEFAMLSLAVKRLEEASDSGRPVVEIAKEIVAEVPRLYLKDMVDAGATSFQDTARQVAARRPDDPDSILLTPRGEAWLRELFSELRRQMEATT